MPFPPKAHSLGGAARAKKLSKRRRREIASLGGQAFAKGQRQRRRLQQSQAATEGQAA